ncbi:hypothetical protein E4634_16190 [Mangrovimicrobium sediminis]|uniref:Uncharacterized protein n=1 Tax=Mangrovimicrobium sediminis TaxID=2562682 RepID=A0A4Z0LYN5_9GAMM|nr:hypothetical protein [Haliea sp. SAOS-164]TGD72205.1 hypothetical protein E4634_16190 [Haliea sp. SAOS-164]
MDKRELAENVLLNRCVCFNASLLKYGSDDGEQVTMVGLVAPSYLGRSASSETGDFDDDIPY